MLSTRMEIIDINDVSKWEKATASFDLHMLYLFLIKIQLIQLEFLPFSWQKMLLDSLLYVEISDKTCPQVLQTGNNLPG